MKQKFTVSRCLFPDWPGLGVFTLDGRLITMIRMHPNNTAQWMRGNVTAADRRRAEQAITELELQT